MRDETIALWNGLLDLIYPPLCLVCRAEQQDAFCPACQRDIQPLLPPFCDRCGEPVSAGQRVCFRCETGPEPPYAWSQALGQYAGTLREAIHRLKYDGKIALALPLGQLLARSLDTSTPLFPAPLSTDRPAFDAVVPVPLHPSKLRKRGFNQAERIARVVAQERGWTLDTLGLRRVRSTKTQTDLAPVERAANVQGAFAARTPLYFDGKSILVLDDVLTTAYT